MYNYTYNLMFNKDIIVSGTQSLIILCSNEIRKILYLISFCIFSTFLVPMPFHQGKKYLPDM